MTMFELYAYESDGFDSYDWMLYDIGTYRECIAAAQRLLDRGADLELSIVSRNV